MTNAPTPRETADHADLLAKLKRAKYVREAHDEPYGTYDQPCDADDYGAEAVPINPDGAVAADALEALLSEIAALRGEVDRWHSAYEIAHDQATANGSAARQAERQRDELLDAALKLSAAISWTDYPFIDNNTSREELISRLGFMQKDAEQPRAFLANQGAHQ